MTTNRPRHVHVPGPMNTTKPDGLTPDDVELVVADDIAVGDVIFEFTPILTSRAIPPTQRQLNAARTSWTRVDTLRVTMTDPPPVWLQIADDQRTPKPVAIANEYTPFQTVIAIGTHRFGHNYEWRVKRSFLAGE
jgi:hypothetical protein